MLLGHKYLCSAQKPLYLLKPCTENKRKRTKGDHLYSMQLSKYSTNKKQVLLKNISTIKKHGKSLVHKYWVWSYWAKPNEREKRTEWECEVTRAKESMPRDGDQSQSKGCAAQPQAEKASFIRLL